MKVSDVGGGIVALELLMGPRPEEKAPICEDCARSKKHCAAHVQRIVANRKCELRFVMVCPRVCGPVRETEREAREEFDKHKRLAEIKSGKVKK